jgi:hypothetical protein
MRRTHAHRFFFIPAVCILAGVGCASQKNLKDNAQPDKNSLTAVVEPTIDKHNENSVDLANDTKQTSNTTIDTKPPDEPQKDSTDSADSGAVADQTKVATGVDSTMADTKIPDPAPQGSIESVDASATVPRPTFEDMHPCTESIEAAAGWLDRGHSQVYQSVCGTVAWFDGFFGDKNYDAASRRTFGRVSLSGFWDQYDGFDPTFRFRAKFALPALKNRTSLLVGRGDERDFIEEQGDGQSDSIPSNFNQVEDDSFLLGLGYQRGTGLKRGVSFSVGVKLRVPPEPYVKARFRRAWQLSDSTLLRLNPILYWKSDEGIGSTLNLNIDHLLSDKFMVRWSGSGNISQDNEVEGVLWNNWLSLFQALTDRNAISYHAFVAGETKAEVELQNYGVEVRYRKRIARKWLFLELISSVTWPRYLLEETRDMNIGIGAGFEMYFGPVPDAQLR